MMCLTHILRLSMNCDVFESAMVFGMNQGLVRWI